MATKLDSFSVLSIEESFSHGNGAAEAERTCVCGASSLRDDDEFQALLADAAA